MLDRRRKFLRFNFAVDVEFNASGVAFSGMTNNVSRDGISFILQSCSVNAGSPLQFQMQNPNQREDTIEACGDITWKRQMGDEWHLGLRFKFINKADKSDILDVAYDNWLSGSRQITSTDSTQSSFKKSIAVNSFKKQSNADTDM
jgi:hypothetical protein